MAYVEVSGLQKSFGNAEVLKGVSFALERGKVLAVIGCSGNGKTTLLRCLNGLEIADGGSVCVDGVTTFFGEKKRKKTHASAIEESRDFTLVFQNFQLFPQYTVLENVTLAADLGDFRGVKLTRKEKSQIKERNRTNACELLKKVGLSEKLNSYPCELSGGQQQRVAIARALALKPKVLCFDEPTSALDPHLTGEISKLIEELKKEGRTMIVVTHEMNFARSIADEILFLHEGRVEVCGGTEEVFQNAKSAIFKQFICGEGNK